MSLYKTKVKKISGTSYREIIKNARAVFHQIEKKSRRSAYIKSPFFNNEKVFLSLFWDHLRQKPQRERKWRLKFLSCAFDLIGNSKNKPMSEEVNPNHKTELLYRFSGLTATGESFFVQIKENRKSGRKDFMSVFPDK